MSKYAIYDSQMAYPGNLTAGVARDKLSIVLFLKQLQLMHGFGLASLGHGVYGAQQLTNALCAVVNFFSVVVLMLLRSAMMSSSSAI